MSRRAEWEESPRSANYPQLILNTCFLGRRSLLLWIGPENGKRSLLWTLFTRMCVWTFIASKVEQPRCSQISKAGWQIWAVGHQAGNGKEEATVKRLSWVNLRKQKRGPPLPDARDSLYGRCHTHRDKGWQLSESQLTEATGVGGILLRDKNASELHYSECYIRL